MAPVPARLTWQRTTVQGRPAVYGVAGQGRPLVFLHGWGLSHRSYRRALGELIGKGVRIYAPALPGFGGTARLPDEDLSLLGFARWVRDFVSGVVVGEEAVILIGHSFGGGVAVQTAHDHPALASRLVLVNSIGGSVWKADGVSRTMRDRPWWDWGLHLTAHALSHRSLTRVLPVIAADAVPNAVRHPDLLWRVGRLAREANLTRELEELRRRRLPVVIVWGLGDRIVPWACVGSLIEALGDPEVLTVPGDHSWLIVDPERFAEIITNVVVMADGESTQAS